MAASKTSRKTGLLPSVTLAKSGRIGGELVLTVGRRAGVDETETSFLRQVLSSADACGAKAKISLKRGFRCMFWIFFSNLYHIIDLSIVYRAA